MLVAILALGLLAGSSGLLLGFAAVRFRVEGDPMLEKIEALLPQTQCGQCGYAGCHSYAEAIASGAADINLCPPGGSNSLIALADLLGRDPQALSSELEEKPPQLAVIDEENCIGCTLCLQACPVDAILGAAKQMHTVIASECTGCELCVAPCPVDCIQMVPITQTINTWKWHSPLMPSQQPLPTSVELA